ncbi:MAG: asparaginase domain-containing protein [Pseudomonadales bacterium]
MSHPDLSVDPEILVITTGGTIDKVYFDAKSDYEVGDSVVGDLLEQAHVHVNYEMIHLMRKDSLELTEDDRKLVRDTIAAREQKLIVVTHGTDTMTDTARALAAIEDCTIVITGALAPGRFAQSDATFNVGMAIAAVQSLDPGVYIVMNGQVFNGLQVRKDRDLNRFVRIAPEHTDHA